VTSSASKVPNAFDHASEVRAAGEGSVTLLIGRLRNGDAEATGQLWSRFFPRLLGLARRTLAGCPQRVADADDAAQSAFLCFWRQAEQGQLSPDMHRDNLWSLLASITVRKALKQVKRERARKRGAGKVLGESALGACSEGARGLEAIVGEFSAADFDIHCEELLEMLDEGLRVFAVLRLMGQTNREIASLLKCTERKVERKMGLIRLCWEDAVRP